MKKADIITSDMKDPYIYLCTVFFEKWITYILLLILGVFTNKLFARIIVCIEMFIIIVLYLFDFKQEIVQLTP